MGPAELMERPAGPGAPGQDALYEVVDGEYREVPYLSTSASMMASEPHVLLGGHARARGLGRSASEPLFGLGTGPTGRPIRRRPDVAFVSYDRWPRERPLPEGGPWDVVPDLAVEFVSPTDQALELRVKVRQYFSAGVRLVWQVYPRLREVWASESVLRMTVLEESAELDGGPVLPGFRLSLAELFGPPAE